MRRISSGPIALAAILLIAASFSSCRSGEDRSSASEAVVYVTVPLSGLRAEAGLSALGGARLAVEEINRSGGLLGRRLVVRALDDQSDKGAALAIVGKIEQAIKQGEHVAGVIGHLDSGPTSSALPHYEEKGLVLITPAAGMRALTHRGHEFFFRVNANDNVQAELSAQFLVETLKARRVAVVHDGTEYGSELAASLADHLRLIGATTAIQVEVKAGQQEGFSPLAIDISDAESDAVYFAGSASAASQLVASLKAANLMQPVLASDAAFLASALLNGGDGASEGLFVSALAPSPDTAAGENWVKAYRAVVRRDPGPFSLNGYVAMQVLAEGVRAANSFQGHEIAQAIREIEIETMLGPIRFSANGDWADARVWFFRVEGGDFRQLD